MSHHPKLDHHGKKVTIHSPSKASDMAAWDDPKASATVLPGGKLPSELNGIALAPWSDAPSTKAEWRHVDGMKHDLDEPPLALAPGKKAASGIVIEEPDGRVWLVAPTNRFGGYHASFPKGNAEADLPLQANAIKEVFEELGLKVEITGLLGDYARTTTVARLYTGKRVGGTPADMGWESQAVHLVPKADLYRYLNMHTDHAAAEAIGAGPRPAIFPNSGSPFAKK